MIRIARIIIEFIYKLLFIILGLLPKQNKVVATTMRGRKYSDNPRYIVESLHSLDPSIKIVWLKLNGYEYNVPNWLRIASYTFPKIKRIYHMATAKVWINSHLFEPWNLKAKNQLFIETWHGGLGIKKILLDTPDYVNQTASLRELKHTCSIADVFISNSKFLDDVYRSAFGYKGKIARIGYPKNDELVNLSQDVVKNVRKQLGVSENMKFLLYAPTFRDSFEKSGVIDYNPFYLDFEVLHKTLVDTYGGDWKIIVKFHPIMSTVIDESYYSSPFVINGTSYSNMQELIAACDIFLTDYSSGIFDSLLKGIPAFTYGLDYEEYKKNRGVYEEIYDLPFPFASNFEELINNLKSFDREKFRVDVDAYLKKVELYEPGNASTIIASKVLAFMNSGNVNWN